MKKLLSLLILILLSSCRSKSPIDSNTLLKELPDNFFSINTTHKIRTSNEFSEYTCLYKRLPNTEFSKFYLKKHPNKYNPYFNITINLSSSNKITFEGVEVYQNELISTIEEFIDFAAEGKKSLIHLNFDETINLKSFISFTTFIKSIESELIKINEQVFIYNLESLPDCDCSL